MKFAAVVIFALCGSMALSQVRITEHEAEDHEFLQFQARLNQFTGLHKHAEKNMKPLTRKEIEAALEQFLPNDPDMREPALAALFLDLMEQGHQNGRGHLTGQGEGRRSHPEAMDRFDGRKFPLPR